MSLGVYFMHTGFSTDKYDEAIRRLEDAGAGAPKGRRSHFALESAGALNVFDVWDSMEEFEAFGATLMPILADLGVEVGEPMIATVHNTISG
jgi:hypothetical protein